VWITNVNTGEARNITRGNGTNWGPAWSPDGKSVAYYSDRIGKVNLWVWSKETDVSRCVSGLALRVNYSFETPQWENDSATLVAVLPAAIPGKNETESSQLNFTERCKGEHCLDRRPTVALLSTRTQSFPDDLNPESTRGDIALFDIKTGRVRLITGGLDPMWYRLSPTGRQLALASRLNAKAQDGINSLADLFIVDLDTGEHQAVAREMATPYGVNFSWSPDGRHIAYTTSHFSQDGRITGECLVLAIQGQQAHTVVTSSGSNFATDFGVPLWDRSSRDVYVLSKGDQPQLTAGLWRLSVADKRVQEIATSSHLGFVEIVASPSTAQFWSPDGGRSMIVMTQDRDTLRSGFDVIDLNTGESSTLFLENKSYGMNGTIWSIDAAADGQVAVYRAQDVTHSEDIWVLRANALNSGRRVTNINRELSTYAMGTSTLIQWTSQNGQPLRGALLLPSSYRKGERYPLIVYFYPGAYKSIVLNNFGLSEMPMDNMQLLATRGYAILCPDVPVSAGTPLEDIRRAVMPAVDKVIELGIADPDRLGLMGHSWGGYGVLSLIVQSDRFKAAVSRSGVGGDLVRYYTTMQPNGGSAGMGETELLETGGTLWTRREAFIANSPVFFFDRVQTPLLLTHGTGDPVSSAYSDEVFVCLKRLGKDVEYAKYEGEDHYEFDWRYANQVDFAGRLIDWFDRHLRNTTSISSSQAH
jgi:dipeptidyl aminopeptidase/acylaminoacyl peptidase